jgi:hypothetical protein
MEPLQQPDIQVSYTEHQRQMAWINENDWKLAAPVRRRSPRMSIAKVLLVLARWIAPARPEREFQMDTVSQR